MNIKYLEVKRAYYNDPENVVVQNEADIGAWADIDGEPSWHQCLAYRIKPRTIRIGEIDVPEPVRESLPLGVKYYFPSLNYSPTYDEFLWQGDPFDNRVLKRGLVHLTKEAAELHAKALILVSGGRVE